MDENFVMFEGGTFNTGAIAPPKQPISKIFVGKEGGFSIEIGVDKKFNWFQKQMIKWCFGFEVKENNNE